MVCPDGSDRRFVWVRPHNRASGSFNEMEALVIDTLVAHAMGGSAGVNKMHPALPKLRRKTMKMLAKARESAVEGG